MGPGHARELSLGGAADLLYGPVVYAAQALEFAAGGQSQAGGRILAGAVSLIPEADAARRSPGVG